MIAMGIITITVMSRMPKNARNIREQWSVVSGKRNSTLDAGYRVSRVLSTYFPSGDLSMTVGSTESVRMGSTS